MTRPRGTPAGDRSAPADPIPLDVASPAGITAVSYSFVMDWAAIWKDLVVGLLIAGALAAWIPDAVWQGLFLTDRPALATVWGPLIGPLIAALSFVCSIGNVPMAAVLWNGGISFDGVLGFIFTGLLILPIFNIYRRYYNRRRWSSWPSPSTSRWPRRRWSSTSASVRSGSCLRSGRRWSSRPASPSATPPSSTTQCSLHVVERQRVRL